MHDLCSFHSSGGDTAHVQRIYCGGMVLSGCSDSLRWTDKGLPKTTVPLTGLDSLRAVLFSFLEPS